jgi:serine/threonine protein kinase
MSAPHLAPGTVLAGRSYNFSIQALVGHSGSAATFRALSSAGGEAMVKVYDAAVRQRPDITQAMERVYAETMQLPGDVIVHVLEAGYDPSTGSPFSATAFVQIPSLAQLVARRPLSAAEVTGMLKSLSRGLDAAHIRQISHHALKPTNVFLGGAPNFEARITDFGAGLVRLAVPTHDGYALSAPWLAPEQVQQGQQAGPAADIFSAALVAFYGLTGRSFWRACQGQSPDLNAWQQELFGGRAVASLRASEIGIPLNPALDPVFSRALAVDPRQRYRTVGELAAAFDAAASQQQAAGATMAFPAIGLDAGPPPGPQTGQPMGGQMQSGPYSPATQALPPNMPAQAQPAQQQQQWGGQGQPSQPEFGAANTGSAGAMTMIPQAADRPRQRASKAVPIFLGITAAVLVGGAVAAFVFLGKDSGSGSGSGGPANAVSVPIPATTPATTETPTATATASATATATATADAPAPEVQVTIKCIPGCDSIQIDGKSVDEVTKPAKIAAGKHTLAASKEGYTPFEETVEVEITGTTAKITFTKDGSPAQTSDVKDIAKTLDHKIALAVAPAAKSTGATAATTPTATATATSSSTKTSTGTGTKKPGCKSKFGVGCK